MTERRLAATLAAWSGPGEPDGTEQGAVTRHRNQGNPAQPKAALADVFRRSRPVYAALPISWHNFRYDDTDHAATIPAIGHSAGYLAEHLHRVPALVIPCVTFRTDDTDVLVQALVWGPVLPSVWSFCLAVRERGLGTCWTSIHLAHEKEAADILGIPYDDVMQVALLPLAYTTKKNRLPTPRTAFRRTASSTGTTGERRSCRERPDSSDGKS